MQTTDPRKEFEDLLAKSYPGQRVTDHQRHDLFNFFVAGLVVSKNFNLDLADDDERSEAELAEELDQFYDQVDDMTAEVIAINQMRIALARNKSN